MQDHQHLLNMFIMDTNSDWQVCFRRIQNMHFLTKVPPYFFLWTVYIPTLFIKYLSPISTAIKTRLVVTFECRSLLKGIQLSTDCYILRFLFVLSIYTCIFIYISILHLNKHRFFVIPCFDFPWRLIMHTYKTYWWWTVKIITW